MLKKLFAGIAIAAMLLVSSPVMANGFWYNKTADACSFAVSIENGNHIATGGVLSFSGASTKHFGVSKSGSLATAGGFAVGDASVLGFGVAGSSASIEMGRHCHKFVDAEASGLSVFGYAAQGDVASGAGFGLSKSLATKNGGATQINIAGSTAHASSGSY